MAWLDTDNPAGWKAPGQDELI